MNLVYLLFIVSALAAASIFTLKNKIEANRRKRLSDQMKETMRKISEE